MIKDVKKAVSLASFGDGLSYTTFEYKNLKITDTIIGSGKESVVTVDVTNKGKMTGKESVLWFITDEHGTITRPVKELKHFEKYQLMPGESKTVEFRINPEKHLSFPDKNGVKRIENGRFRVQVGKHKKGIQYNSKNNQDVY